MIQVRLSAPDAESLVLEELKKSKTHQLRACSLIHNSLVHPLKDIIKVAVSRLANDTDPEVRTAGRKILGYDQSLPWLARQVNAENFDQPRDHNSSYNLEARRALAILAFLGDGYDHKTPNKYKRTIQKLLDSLLQSQHENGTFANDPTENALIVYALAELYAMTADPVLLEPLKRGMTGLRSAWHSHAADDLWSQDSHLAMNQVFAWKSLYAGGACTTNELAQLANGFNRMWATAAPDFTHFPWFDNGKVSKIAPSTSLDAAQCANILLGRKISVRESPALPVSELQTLHGYWWTFSHFERNEFPLVVEQWKILKDTQVFDYGGPNDGSWNPTLPGEDRFIVTIFSILNQQFYFRSLIVHPTSSP